MEQKLSTRRRRNAAMTFSLAALGIFAQAAPTDHRLSVSIPRAACMVSSSGAGQRVHADGFGTLHEPGVPQLPVRIFPIAVPPGAEVLRVAYTAAEPVAWPATCDVAPAPVWEPITGAGEPGRAAEQARFDENYAAIYGSDAPYPPAPVEFVRTAAYRGYDLVDVRVTPIAYRPRSGQLLPCGDITVHIDYRLPEQPVRPITDSSAAIRRSARALILNYDEAAGWYAGPAALDSLRYEFVIITLDNLVSAVAPLVAWEQQKGRGVQVVTTSWIAARYAGVDLPEKIRNYLRDRYPAGVWGIEQVLLVAHYNDLPMRLVWQDVGYGRPYTDTYYAELSRPDHESWDRDDDRRYAEEEDEIDFYNEVCVGRIPWSEPAIVAHICEKSVLFEQNADPAYKRNILLLGGFFWPDTDCAVLMETIAALPQLGDWTSTRMYELGYSTYPMNYDLTRTNVVSAWSGHRYAVVTWCGHGSPTSAHRYYPNTPAFIASADCAALNDSYPSVVFADSCLTSSPSYANLGREMLRCGAVGYVGATQVAGGRRGWQRPADGSSQTLNYLFTAGLTDGGHTQGEALDRALRESYLQGAWRWPKYELLEWGALYGNPNLGIGGLPAVRIRFPAGLPGHCEPNVPTTIAVRIDPVLDTLVAASETLHVRMSGGAFLDVPLRPLGDRRYEAVLPPALCNERPEFFISARGQASGLVTLPPDAPAAVCTVPVGTFRVVFGDNFEQNRGWTAENLGATDGDWQRGVPVNDPSWPYDPCTDADGSGRCYLTANRSGNSDVDGGSVRLTSPLLDLTAENTTLRYSFYLYAEDQEAPDYLLVEASSNGLAGPWRELVRHIRNNGLSWRTDSFTGADLQARGVALTDRVHVRFTACDGGADHVVEAGVDAFEVRSFGCAGFARGDLNCDAHVDFNDISPFVLALSDPASYHQQHPACNILSGDCNGNGRVEFGDITPFVALLAGD
ncbi:MAG: C25 family cysteine peptidase [Planctomycetota bacterium]